jgi:hypothetical protein
MRSSVAIMLITPSHSKIPWDNKTIPVDRSPFSAMVPFNDDFDDNGSGFKMQAFFLLCGAVDEDPPRFRR